MSKSKASGAMFLTTAEARAEAAYLVLEILLRRISQSECRRIMAEAELAAEKVGLSTISEEVQGLFDGIEWTLPVR